MCNRSRGSLSTLAGINWFRGSLSTLAGNVWCRGKNIPSMLTAGEPQRLSSGVLAVVFHGWPAVATLGSGMSQTHRPDRGL